MKKQYKIDLHTHSIISHDGGIKKKEYARLLRDEILDCVAITDHNETSFARMLHKEFGDKIIIGEEIKTTEGEIIGLFLIKTVSAGLSPKETVREIHQQGGLVYIPHPFETRRSGILSSDLELIVQEVDIIETFNARGYLRGKYEEATDFAKKNNIAQAASSDAHCRSGIGTAFSTIDKMPTKNNLIKLLKKGKMEIRFAPWYSYICPGINKIKNKIILGV